MEPDIPEVPVTVEGRPSQASNPPRHAVVRLVALMFYKMLGCVWFTFSFSVFIFCFHFPKTVFIFKRLKF